MNEYACLAFFLVEPKERLVKSFEVFQWLIIPEYY